MNVRAVFPPATGRRSGAPVVAPAHETVAQPPYEAGAGPRARRSVRGRRGYPTAGSCPLLLLLSIVLTAAPAAAQDGFSAAGRLYLTRGELVAMEAEYGALAESPAYSPALREEAARTLQRIRERLTEGDFREGDRITVTMQEEALSGEYVVEPGPEIVVPTIGAIPLRGVLRSELEGHITEELDRFLRSPSARASSTIRLRVEGAVGRPGFYVLPATLLLSDVVMAAGGPAGNADLDQMRVERGGQPLLSAETIRPAVAAGRSLDQLNLQAGDEIHVPARTPSILGPMLLRYGLIIGSSLLLGFRIF